MSRSALDRAVPEHARPEFISVSSPLFREPIGEPPEVSAAAAAEIGYPNAAGGETVALEHMQAVQQTGAPNPALPLWRSLGPTTIPNGQTYNSSIRVNVSGRVAAIAVDPHNAAHVLCGAANGGVWESFDRGGSWAPRTDYQATTAVGAIVFSPQNPSIVYCGTGEGNWWSWLGVGILKSSNGGATWTTLCTNPFVGQGFFDLVVDHTNGNRLYAATTGGLFVSNDGGVSWTLRRNVVTWTIAIGAGEVLAACRDGVWRSSDNGVTWTLVAVPGAVGSFDRAAVSIAPSNASVAYVWAANGTAAHLWRRSGGAWSAASSLPPGLSTGQSWYDWYCAVAPDRDGEVYLGAIEAYRGDLSGSTWTWTVISNHTGGAIHHDQHAVAFEPGNPNTIYAGCDGGLFRSQDRGNTWAHCNNGLVISEFEYIAQNVGSSRWLIGGTQDNGTERWTGSSAWDHVADGDGGFVAVNYTNPQTVFHTYYGMSPEVSTVGANFGSWSGIAPPVPAGETAPFYPPMRCTDSTGNTVAIGGGALYVSRANGSGWVRLAYPSVATASAVCAPNSDNVFVGVQDGRVFHTRWSGAAWTALTALTTPRANATVSDFLISASNLNRIWATYSTIGGGHSFPVGRWRLALDRLLVWNSRRCRSTRSRSNSRDANRVWVAMDRGVSESRDSGAHWADFSNGLPNAYVGDLCFHPHAWVLRAGTRNRGVWEIPVDGWMTAPICGVQFTGAVPANQTHLWFTFNWPATWDVIWTVMPTTIGTQAQLTLTVEVQRSSAEFVTYWLKVQNLTATAVNFEGRYCILSRH